MKKIIDANHLILKILKKPNLSSTTYRLIRFCLTSPVDDGVLLYNTLTKELLHLSEEEFANAAELPYLKERWFSIPTDMKEEELVELVRLIMRISDNPEKHKTHYTIFTTTDCNARCFYCYENGCKKVTMSEETAHKTAEFIKDNCGGKDISICWYGGEPLLNTNVIDIICDDLRALGVTFTSFIITNGYLFDDDTIERAKTHWNLNKVKITVDGTEEIYNRSKAYVYKNGSAYQIVKKNISHIVEAGITAKIRMNINLKNAKNLMLLVDEFGAEFSGNPNLQMYIFPIFDKKNWDERYTKEEWTELYDTLFSIQDKILSYKIAIPALYKLPKAPRYNRCMADSSNSLVITPEGNIGLCDHYSENGFIGHISCSKFDEKMAATWREQSERSPLCDTCPILPDCIFLKRCAGTNTCFEHLQRHKCRTLTRTMHKEYEAWLQNNS